MITKIKMKNQSSIREEAFLLLERYLKSQGLKMTEPRRVVLDVFLRIEQHVTTEDLYEAVRKVEPRIGQATVFRTVKLLEDAGLARAACREDGPRRFEHAFQHAHHDHLVCVDCGEIVEFNDTAIEAAQESIYSTYGYSPVGHSLELRGRCPSCSGAKSRAVKG